MASGVYFPVAAIGFSLLTIITFYVKKPIKSTETRIYKYLMISNFLGLILELNCTFAAYISNDFFKLSDFILKTYLVYNLIWTLILTIYVMYISIDTTILNKYKKVLKILIGVIVLFSTYFIYSSECNLVIKGDFRIRYTEGVSVDFTYTICGILIFLIVVLIANNKKNLNNKKYIPIYVFLVAIICGIIIQKSNPGLLIMTYVETLTVAIMYHTIENPDTKMLEEVHKAKVISDNANEEKTLFLYNMTNEIRGITKDIDKETDNILDETDNKKIDVEEINNSARNIKGSTAKFTTMTNEILDISSIDSASVRIYNEKYNIKRLLKELVGIYKPKAQNKNLDFRVSIASDIPEYLYGDSINLKKVLTIILDNSIKYTNNGYIEFNINTIIKGDIVRLIISVEDSGIGMKAEDINKIFTKKQEREDNHNLNNNLYNAKRLITLMNGTIVPSSSYGSGTTIKIILDQKYDTIDTDINKYDNIYDKKKVLLIDDSPSSEKLFNKILSGTNIELTSVKLGKEGLEKIRNKEKYDLILLDEELEPQNGHIIMQKLLEIRNFNTKVILLTKDNKYDYDDSYLQEGFTDYIIKSSDKEEMLNKINKYLK